jgi:hypothetical protein
MEVAPYFIVDDVVVTANFYRDKLGFHYERFWGDPPCFCMVQRTGIIMLSQLDTPGSARPNRLVDPNGDAWDACIWVDNAEYCVFVKDLVDCGATTHGVVFAKYVAQITKQQGRYAVGHGLSPLVIRSRGRESAVAL